MTSPVRILGVIDEEPYDAGTWSGSSQHFFGSLARAGRLAGAVSATPSRPIQLLHKLTSFHPNYQSWRFSYHLNVPLRRDMTRTAVRRLSQTPRDDYEAVLQIGAWYDLSDFSRGKIHASYHDGNIATRLASPYGYPRIPAARLSRALRYENNLYRRVHAVFPMSQWLGDSFLKDFDVPASKIFPVGAGVNLPWTGPTHEKQYDQPRILFVGKAFERKGGDTLLRAFRRVRRHISNATLTIVGHALRDPPDGVQAIGSISKSCAAGIEKLINEYTNASLFVLPSRYEPFGIAFVEAMAHAVPCIGTRTCAIPEIVRDGQSGYLIDVDNDRQLSDRMIELLSDPLQARQMGANGYRQYATQYNWDEVTRRMADVLDTI